MVEAEHKRAEAEEKLQETLNVLKEGVAGSSGEAVLSSAAAQVFKNNEVELKAVL